VLLLEQQRVVCLMQGQPKRSQQSYLFAEEANELRTLRVEDNETAREIIIQRTTVF